MKEGIIHTINTSDKQGKEFLIVYVIKNGKGIKTIYPIKKVNKLIKTKKVSTKQIRDNFAIFLDENEFGSRNTNLKNLNILRDYINSVEEILRDNGKIK